MASINLACNKFPTGKGAGMQKVLADILADLTALRAAFVALTAKLDSNHAVATDHAATTNPAALKTST